MTELWFEELKKKQDACYHKVKSRYKKWPSAYASGALVRCRKVGMMRNIKLKLTLVSMKMELNYILQRRINNDY